MMNKQASVLLYAMMLMAVIVFFLQAIIQTTFIERLFTKVMIGREQAELLAVSGIDLAVARLTLVEKDDKKDEDVPSADGKPVDKQTKQLRKQLHRILPHLNRWQTFTFKEKSDGFDGEIKLCISCEAGKINLNEAFDFKKMDFNPPYNTYFKGLEIQNVLKSGELYERLVTFFKKRKKKLDDISQLTTIKELKMLGSIFYVPPKMPEAKHPSQSNRDIALTDLFTIWSKDATVNPLWFSDSMRAVLGLRRPHADDEIKHEEEFKKSIAAITPAMAQDWDANWAPLEPLYGAKSQPVTDFKAIFTKEFEPRIYSVLSCGKVEQVECSVLAIIELQDNKQKPEDKKADTAANASDQDANAPVPLKKKYKILRMYWM